MRACAGNAHKARAPRGQFLCQHASLTKPANAIVAGITAQIRAPDAIGGGIAGQGLRNGARFGHAGRVVIKVFRQIMHRGLQAVMQRVGFLVGGVAQRPDLKWLACVLKGDKFLRDEGLRQAWPAFDQYGERRAFSGHSAASRGSWCNKASTRVVT